MGLMDFLKKGEEKPAQNTGAPQPAAQQTTGGQTGANDTYTVRKGDSLSKIAKEYYGDAKQWPKIFEANRDQIKDPNLIEIGQVLKVPRS